VAFSLTLDRIQVVRLESVRNLTAAAFDEQTLAMLLMNAVSDKSDQVKCAAAAPTSFVKEFCQLLENPEVTEGALLALPAMAAANGLGPFLDSMSAFANAKRDAVGAALLEAVRFMRDGEADAVLRLAALVAGSRSLMARLREFAEGFSDRRAFLGMLRAVGCGGWRDRVVVIGQCLAFIDDFGEGLVDTAVALSADEVAIIRIMSAQLWQGLIERGFAGPAEVGRLLGGGWQMRMVAAKVVGAQGEGSRAGFAELAARLSRDEVQNVRFCLASCVRGTPLFDRLFGATTDCEIDRLAGGAP